MRQEYLIRFVTTERHPPYGHRTGIFQTAYRLLREAPLVDSDRAEMRLLLDWFNDNLAEPDRLAGSRRSRGQTTAISWMRASAKEHVSQLRRLAEIIEGMDITVEELRTARPGYLLYEDEHQIVALPFADDRRAGST